MPASVHSASLSPRQTSGLNRQVLRLAAYWVGATLLLRAGPTPFAAASWQTQLIYFMVGANCLVVLAGLAVWHRSALGPAHLQPPPLSQRLGNTVDTALEVAAVLLMAFVLNKILI